MKKNIFYIIIITTICLFTASCEKKQETALRGSWHLKSINFIFKYKNGTNLDVAKDGTTVQKIELYDAVENLKPLVYTFTDKSMFWYQNKKLITLWENVSIKNNIISWQNEENNDSYEISYQISDKTLTLTWIDNHWLAYTNNAPLLMNLINDATVESYQFIITLNRGGVKDKEEYIEPPEEYEESETASSKIKQKVLPQVTTSGNIPESQTLKLYTDTEKKLYLYYKENKLCLLAVDNNNNNIYLSSNGYDNHYIIYFETGIMSSLSQISETREFGSGNGYTPTSFSMEYHKGYVVGFKIGTKERFVRIWISNTTTNNITVQYQNIDSSQNGGTKIGGIVWANFNVNTPGTFTENETDFGFFYQWNRPIGWDPDELINSYGSTVWNSSIPSGTIWEESNNVCPEGWRLPTSAEMQNLVESGNTWTTKNGVYGREFGIGSNKIFLPAAGYRNPNNGERDNRLGNNAWGDYWTSNYNNLIFNNGSSNYHDDHCWVGTGDSKAFGFSVRCVEK